MATAQFVYFSAILHLLIDVRLTVANCEKASITTVSGSQAPAGKLCPQQLIFEDNFDDLNLDTWHRVATLGGSWDKEFQWYTDSPENSYTANGHLVIEPTLTTDHIPDLTKCHILLDNCDNHCERWCTTQNIAPPVRSARLNSREGFAFKYGRVEIRAKLPTGDWLWPALWMMPKENFYGGWPISGEFDLMESRGNRNFVEYGRQIGVQQCSCTLHFGTVCGHSAWRNSHFVRNTPVDRAWNRGYHLYQVDWTPEHITFSVDNQVMGTIDTGDGFYKRGHFTGPNPWANGGLNAPFDREFFFILNVAVGGTSGYFPDAGNAGGKPWRNEARWAERDFWDGRDQWLGSWNFNAKSQFSSSMLVDYVRVFAI